MNTSHDFTVTDDYGSVGRLNRVVIQEPNRPRLEDIPAQSVKVSKLVHNRYRHNNIFPGRNGQTTYETESRSNQKRTIDQIVKRTNSEDLLEATKARMPNTSRVADIGKHIRS